MPDREKVIKGCENWVNNHKDEDLLLAYSSVVELLAMLKEQDPVETELEGGGSSWWYVCGDCHGAIDQRDNYCKHCGRRIKHEKKAE